MAKILIVDDSLTMRNVLIRTLVSGNHSVDHAEDGYEAYVLAKVTGHDLVATDLNMPRMNGVELITKLRLLPNFARVPILTISTEKGAQRDAARKAGSNGHMVKPFDPDRLLEVVQLLLERHHNTA